MGDVVSISGEITLLYEDVDAYGEDVILLSLDPDDLMAFNTFEVRGDLASRLRHGLREGMRVRVDCRSDTVEVVNPGTGETHDDERPVVVDVLVLSG